MAERPFLSRKRVLAAILLTTAAVARLCSECSLYAVGQPLGPSERTPTQAAISPAPQLSNLESPKEQRPFEDIACFEPDLNGKLYHGMLQPDAVRALKRAGYLATACSFAPGRRSFTVFERNQLPTRWISLVCGRASSEKRVHGYELQVEEWKGYVAGYTYSPDGRFVD